jgi:FkbM family methyltransferase
MSDAIKKILNRNINFCDVGARWGVSEPWKNILTLLDLVYFEPDREEFEALKKRMRSNDAGYDYALYSRSGSVDLHLTKARECTSILTPDYDLLQRFPQELLGMYEIENTISIQAKTIDEIYYEDKTLNIDFIKLDVQGAELEIMKGGHEFLENHLIGAEIEVEYLPIYKKQPLFSDVDVYMRNNTGLELFDLTKHYCKYKAAPTGGAKKGQVVFGDALYMRSPFTIVKWCGRFDKQEAANKLIAAFITGYIYGYLDYSMAILSQEGVRDILDEKTIFALTNLYSSSTGSLSIDFRGSGRVSELFSYFSRIFQRTHKGWASSEGRLGTRKSFGVFN